MDKRCRLVNCGKKNYIVNSYFVGGKNIDDVLARIAISAADEETQRLSRKFGVAGQGGNS